MMPRKALIIAAILAASATITTGCGPEHSAAADSKETSIDLTPLNQIKYSGDASNGAALNTWEDYFTIDTIALPKHINPQIGGLTVTKGGQVAVVFHGGELAIYHPKKQSWQQYASGLHEPLGVMEDNDGSFVVMQHAELTKLIDENDDGSADFYMNLSNAFGNSGNYHEFAYGPTRDQEGNYYYALNVASNMRGISKHIRGEYSKFCMDQNIMENYQTLDWKSIKQDAGRMFSCVPYRGWIMKVTPEGETIPYALGFRSPNGLTIDGQNRLWATDNQGDWLPTSPLYHVEEGDFFGHTASLGWKEDQKVKPLDMPVETLNKMRKPAAALFPQGELANSPTKPIPTTLAKHFGLPTDELLIGDMNQFHLIRYLPDFVNGIAQGTLIPFLQTTNIGRGNNRMSFDAEGNLWIGKTHLSWAGDEGIRKISWNQEPYLIADKVSLTKRGFNIHFNHPIDALPEKIEMTQHTYEYAPDYGGPKVDLKDVEIVKQTLSDDGHWLNIELSSITEHQLYTITLNGVSNKNGKPLMGNVLRYNLVTKY